jgi:hypothetical protein
MKFISSRAAIFLLNSRLLAQACRMCLTADQMGYGEAPSDDAGKGVGRWFTEQGIHLEKEGSYGTFATGDNYLQIKSQGRRVVLPTPEAVRNEENNLEWFDNFL